MIWWCDYVLPTRRTSPRRDQPWRGLLHERAFTSPASTLARGLDLTVSLQCSRRVDIERAVAVAEFLDLYSQLVHQRHTQIRHRRDLSFDAVSLFIQRRQRGSRRIVQMASPAKGAGTAAHQ